MWGLRWKNASAFAPGDRCEPSRRRSSSRASLDRPLGPSELLGAERHDVVGELGGDDDVFAVDEAPAGELGAVAEVQVLGQRVVLPAAAVPDGGLAPHAPGAGEVEQPAGRGADAVLDDVVPVQHQRADAREERLLAVEVTPAALHHADVRILEVGDQAAEEVRLGQEVGVEHRDQLALGHLQPRVERAGLVAGALRAVQVRDVQPARAQPPDRRRQQGAGLVRGVVEDLELEAGGRVFDLRHLLEQAHGDVRLVVERELDRDGGQVGPREDPVARDRRHACRQRAQPVAEARAHDQEVGAVEAVDGQQQQHREIEAGEHQHRRPRRREINVRPHRRQNLARRASRSTAQLSSIVTACRGSPDSEWTSPRERERLEQGGARAARIFGRVVERDHERGQRRRGQAHAHDVAVAREASGAADLAGVRVEQPNQRHARTAPQTPAATSATPESGPAACAPAAAPTVAAASASQIGGREITPELDRERAHPVLVVQLVALGGVEED